MSGRSSKVKVWIRVRPTANFAHDMLAIEPDNKSVQVHGKRDSRRGVVNNQILDWSFKMDGIFQNSSQGQVFETVAADIVTGALNGYNGTVMCYGQTGAGKTFTMTGATENYKNRGLVPLGIQQIFRDIDERTEEAISIRISYLEIYNETMFDLLATLPETLAQAQQQNTMTVLEDENGVYVKGLSCHLAQNEEEALNLLFEGETNRAIAAHTLNKQSSRSHCIFTVYIETRSRVQSDARYTLSKLNFVDLAGSERLGKTQSQGKTQQEAMYINKSLSFLEQTVIALADKKRDHVPFRQTKLTHCLKDSIGGNCNTLLIANIWGESQQLEETISTLRFATRMMCVASTPAINQHYDPAIMVKKLEREIESLKRELAMHDTLTNRTQITYDPLSEQQRYEIKQQVRQYIDGFLDEIDIVNVRQITGVFEAFREICHQMKGDIELELRSRFTLVDKTDRQAIAAAQQAGININDEGELVGEPDGSSFGVGQAPASSRPAQSSVVNAKRREQKKGKGRDKSTDKDRTSPSGARGAPSPASTRAPPQDGSSSQTPSGAGAGAAADSGAEKRDLATPSSAAGEAQAQARPGTPPPRQQAFEEFKREVGSEINRILTENKEMLGAKKKAYADFARQINLTKMDIDQARLRLEQLKEDREQSGPMYNEDGDIIISEDEYLEIKKVKDLKSQYRHDFEELKALKSEIQYCQKLVDQCRQKLIQEFDQWYGDSYLSAEEAGLTSADAGLGARAGTKPLQKHQHQTLEDEQEKFERLQMELLLENPNSAAFYNAKMRTERRKTYEGAMRQSQQGGGMTRMSPGTPTRQLKQQPPQRMEVV